MKKKKIIALFIVIVVAIGAGAFYGGVKYGRKGFISEPSRDALLSGFKSGQQGQIKIGGGSRALGGFVNGEIVSKDSQSITIKLQNGSSKIVFYSASAEIGKFTEGGIEDLEIGGNVMVNGKINQDGSITADSIQIRPVVNSR